MPWLLESSLNSPPQSLGWTENGCLALLGQQPEAAGPPDTGTNVQGGVHDSEDAGPAGRHPWALLEQEAAGSRGRRKASCWQAPPSSISQEVRQMSSDEQTRTGVLIAF